MMTQTHEAPNIYSDAVDSLTPYKPRRLTRAELKRKDVYAFTSPKLGRVVWVVGVLQFATALKLEFDTEVTAYAERPRTLKVADDKTIEVAYWTRHTNGEEHLWLLVPSAETESASAARTRHRNIELAMDAAQTMQISVKLLPEADLVVSAPSTRTWLALLPFVQTADVMDNATVIKARVEEHFEFVQASTFAQVEQSLAAFNAHDVRSVICQGIHSAWLKIDPTKPLHAHTIIQRGPRHAHG